MKNFLVFERRLEGQDTILLEAWFSLVYGPFLDEDTAVLHLQQYGMTNQLYVVVSCYRKAL